MKLLLAIIVALLLGIYHSPVDGEWHVLPRCDGTPGFGRFGIVSGCIGR